MTVVIWIPGAPRSPNRRPRTTRERMSLVKTERDKAYACAVAVRNVRGLSPIAGPALIGTELHLRRPRDPWNAVASLKAVQDGLCRALLPLGDGPETPYTWLPPVQVMVPRDQEGVLFQIEMSAGASTWP